MERCGWCLCNEKMTKYHDEEWGVPVHDDRKQFEFLMMEVMQCGLNWNMMRRSARKIRAVIQNAQCFRAVREEYGSFSAYLWQLAGGKPIRYMGHQKGALPAKNGLSDRIARDLKKRGFKYLGSVTVYSHLQACGIINDHVETCFRYGELVRQYSGVRKRKDGEE